MCSTFGSLRPFSGSPRVVPLTVVTAGVGVGNPNFQQVTTPGSYAGSVIVAYDVFVGSAAVFMHILGSEGDEQVGIPLAAGSFYSIMLTGISGFRFRSATAGATVTVVMRPQMTDRPIQNPETLLDAEDIGLPPAPDFATPSLVSSVMR